MSITYVGKSASFASGTGALTVTVPTGYASGDFLIIVCESANQAISLTTTGWEEWGTQSLQATGTAATAGGLRLAVFGKFATTSESSVTVADSGDHTTAIMLCFRGVDPTTIYNAMALGTGTSSTAISCPAVTTTVTNCMIINFIGLDYDGASTARLSGWTNANLVSITEAVDTTVSSGYGGGIGVGYGIKASAGSTGKTTVTESSATVHTYFTLALAPLVSVTVSGYTYSKISSSVPTSVVTFTCTEDITQWEARATISGQTPSQGVGLLVGSGTTLTAGSTGSFNVDYTELTNGDLTYQITIYVYKDGVWY